MHNRRHAWHQNVEVMKRNTESGFKRSSYFGTETVHAKNWHLHIIEITSKMGTYRLCVLDPLWSLFLRKSRKCCCNIRSLWSYDLNRALQTCLPISKNALLQTLSYCRSYYNYYYYERHPNTWLFVLSELSMLSQRLSENKAYRRKCLWYDVVSYWLEIRRNWNAHSMTGPRSPRLAWTC